MTAPTGAIAEIDLGALRANYHLLNEKTAPHRCAAVVKANAYGLGCEAVAQALWEEGATRFFVATIEEGMALRKVLPNAYIGVFYGIGSREDALLAIENKLQPSLNSLGQLELWRGIAQERGNALPASLHVDTGMTRLGLSHADAEQVAAKPELLQGVELQWLMSHLSCAGSPEQPLNLQQLKRFEAVQALFPQVPTSFANSSGIFLGQGYHGQLPRPGAALYGINPTPYAPLNPMQTVVTFKAPILQIRTLSSDESVGYGATYQAEKGARLATVGCGYADSLIRHMSNASRAYVAGSYVPVAGIVSMDLTVIDISSLPEKAIQAGDMVEFVGENLPVDDVAESVGTISYELFTSIGGRVKRNYIPAK